MHSQLNIPITVLVAAVSLTATASIALAGPVPAGTVAEVQHCFTSSSGACVWELLLKIGDQVSGRISASPVPFSSGDFWVTGPSDVTLYKSGLVNNSAVFLFTAFGNGVYELHFVNQFSPPNSQVIVSYIDDPPADC